MNTKKQTKTSGNFPQSLTKNIEERRLSGNYRKLTSQALLYDFCSNDYLGFARHKEISEKAYQLASTAKPTINSSTSSRLIRGNYPLLVETEEKLASFYESPAALLFNSGYVANLGLLSTVIGKHNIALYDELAHASIRDGLQLAQGKSFKFKHNDEHDLAKKIQFHKEKNSHSEIFVITEAVFSMDGDGPNLNEMLRICKENDCYLIVDEAHSNPIFPLKDLLSRHTVKDVFARIVTFGKAFGVHGAAILGSHRLKDYLINFCRSFIYTTAPSPHTIAAISVAHDVLAKESIQLEYLQENCSQFRSVMHQLRLDSYFIESFSPIQSCIISGNKKVAEAAQFLQEKQFDVRAIKSPSVPKGKERLRFCLHSFNNPSEIEAVLKNLSLFIHSKKE